MDRPAFIREVARRMRCDEQRADALAFVVLRELGERLTPKEVADVAAQMPHALKDILAALERPSRLLRRLDAAEFITQVRELLGLPDEAEARRAVLCVFAALQELLGSPGGLEGEAWDVLSQLPKDLKKLWIEAARVTAE